MASPSHDLLIVGAGISGPGIARDAALRGLSVVGCDRGDIAGATTSALTRGFCSSPIDAWSSSFLTAHSHLLGTTETELDAPSALAATSAE